MGHFVDPTPLLYIARPLHDAIWSNCCCPTTFASRSCTAVRPRHVQAVGWHLVQKKVRRLAIADFPKNGVAAAGGKIEAAVVALDLLKDLNATWAPNNPTLAANLAVA